MDEADKNELIAWSKRGNILTRLTSFVGISQKQNQVSFMTSSSVHGAIVKADHFEQCCISEARMQKKVPVKWVELDLMIFKDQNDFISFKIFKIIAYGS